MLPDRGQQVAFETLLNVRMSEDLLLRLFDNDREPAPGDTEADYEEASFPGYAPAVLPGWEWSIEGRRATMADRTFERSGTGRSVLIYGFLITQGEALVSARRFRDGPYQLTNAGDSITVTPILEREV